MKMRVLASHFLTDHAFLSEIAHHCGFGGWTHVRDITVHDLRELLRNPPDLVYLAGGSDVDSHRYGGDASLCNTPILEIDKWDKTFIPIAIQHDWPIFGVCRGHQTLYVELKGSIKEDIYPPNGDHPSTHHMISGEWGEWMVNTLHHQAIDDVKVPDDVQIIMRSWDEVVEIYTCGNHIMGVQFHPEMTLFTEYWELVDAVMSHRADQITEFHPREGVTYA